MDSLSHGGAENLVLDTIALLNEEVGYESSILTLEGGPQHQRASQLAKLKTLDFSRRGLIGSLREIRTTVRKNDIDIVHSHLFRSTLLSRVAKPRNVKLVSTYHSKLHCSDNEYFSRKQLWADRLTFRRKYFTIYVSEPVKKCIAEPLGIKGNHMVLPNFANPKFNSIATRPSSNGLRLISVGHLRPQKNHSLTVQALGELNDLDISVDIFGSGPDEEILSKQIAELKARVVLKGTQEISSELFSSYDAFLMPSKNEGMPIALLEALAAGMPCIVSDIAEISDTAGEAAIYFKSMDVGSLSAVLRSAYEDRSVVDALRTRAIGISEKFDPGHYLSRLTSFYQGMLAQA